MARTQQQTDDTAQARTIAEAMAALGKPISHTQALTVLAKLGGRKSRHETPAATAAVGTRAPEIRMPLRPFPVPRNVALATGLGGEDFDAWFERHIAAAFPGERAIDVIPAGTTFGITTSGGVAGTFRALKPIWPATLDALAKPIFDYTSKKTKMNMTNEHLGCDYSYECAATETMQALLRHLYEEGFIEPADRMNLHFETEGRGLITAYETDSNHNAKFHYQHGLDDYDVANPPDIAELTQPDVTITGRLIEMSRNAAVGRRGKIDVGTPGNPDITTFMVPNIGDRDVVVLTGIPENETMSLTGRMQQGVFLVTKATSKGYDLVKLAGSLVRMRIDGAPERRVGIMRVTSRTARVGNVEFRIADINEWSVSQMEYATVGDMFTIEGVLHGSTMTVTHASAR